MQKNLLKIYTSIIVCFLLLACLLLSLRLYQIKINSGTKLVGDKTFGDIRIYQSVTHSDIPEDNHQNLFLEKDGKLFLIINQYLAGKTNMLFLYNGKSMNPIVAMSVDLEGIQWEHFKYGTMGEESEPVNGYVYLDEDIDGKVDLIIKSDEIAKSKRIFALIDNNWRNVTFMDFNKKVIKVDHEEEEIPMCSSLRNKEPNTLNNKNTDTKQKPNDTGPI